MRIMGIDYGDARTGVAVSDMMNFMTGDAFVIESWKPEHVAEEIAREDVYKRQGGVSRYVVRWQLFICTAGDAGLAKA